MDRKGIIAIVLCLVVLVWWQLKSQREMDAWRRAHPVQATEQTPQPTAPPAQAQTGAAPLIPAQTEASPALPPEAPEKKLTLRTENVEYTFTNQGGGIASARLLRHEAPGNEDNVTLNTLSPHPIGALMDDPAAPGNPAYELTEKEGSVIATRRIPNGPLVTKTFTPSAKHSGGYTIGLKVTFSNPDPEPIEKAGYYLHTGTIGPLHARELPYYSGLDWSSAQGKVTRIDPKWFDAKHIPLTSIERSPAHTYYLETPGNVLWAGVKNQYFTSVITAGEKNLALGVWGERIAMKPGETETHGMSGALAMPAFKLASGESLTQEFTLYVGPKEYNRLAALGDSQAELMNFGMFKLICIALLKAMNWLESFLGSYALAIIVLTFIVRGALWPVQGKATSSMKRMQLLQPKMAEMKEKFKDDPARMNQEMMKLYKDYGINPFAGCLPMLIQIPIFFGFYSMLGTAVELRHSSFLWVHDLSLPDTVGHLLGFPINILPLLMAGTMVWQMQLTPRSGDPMQQRVFMFMPLMFVVFTYNFASALALYYTVQNILSILQLYVTRNEPMPALVKKTPAPKPGRKRK